MTKKIILEQLAREEILDGHAEIAPIERKKRVQLMQGNACEQSNRLVTSASEGINIQGGPIVETHPDFRNSDGLPSEFLPEQNEIDEIFGDAILYANEADKEKLAYKLGLSKDALEDKLKNQLKLRNQLTATPGSNAPRPRPGFGS